MGRIRTVKPELFTHADLYDAESDTGLPLRLAFIGLWTAADREGRFKWRPRELKLAVLPFDDIDFGEVLEGLWRGGFIIKYMAAGEPYGAIPSWNDHQAINQRESASRLPSPTGAELAAIENTQGARVGANIPKSTRALVFERDGGICARCGSVNDLTIDHIIPRSSGGTHDPSNLRVLCRKCNSGRPVAGTALLEDLARDGVHCNSDARTCSNVHARGEGKGKEGNGKEGKEYPLAIASGSLEALPTKPAEKERDPLRDALAASFLAKTRAFASPAKENANLLKLAAAIRRKCEFTDLDEMEAGQSVVETFWRLHESGKQFYSDFTPSKALAILESLWVDAERAAAADDTSWIGELQEARA